MGRGSSPVSCLRIAGPHSRAWATNQETRESVCNSRISACAPEPWLSADHRLAGGAIVAVAVFAAAAAPRPTTPPAPPDVVAARADTDGLAVNNVVYQGWKMFEVYCTRCHGDDAVGSSFAPALRKSVGPSGTIDHKAFFQTVTNGRPRQGDADMGEHVVARTEGRHLELPPRARRGRSRRGTAASEARREARFDGPAAIGRTGHHMAGTQSLSNCILQSAAALLIAAACTTACTTDRSGIPATPSAADSAPAAVGPDRRSTGARHALREQRGRQHAQRRGRRDG